MSHQPERFRPTLGTDDLRRFALGQHPRLWQILGAHPRTCVPLDRGAPVAGTSFAVWAPNARAVTVVGDFNGWDAHATRMRKLGASGIWETFVPGVGSGSLYKYRVYGADGGVVEHADPIAFATEVPPATASMVATARHDWQDSAWMDRRAGSDPLQSAMVIYEVHLGSWRPGLTYRQLAAQLTTYVLEHGFTHVEFLPITEHPFGGSWGYQVTSYFAPTARFGSPDDFRFLVDELHRAGIGVLLDWVPAHFPRDDWALARFDGTPIYEHSDPARRDQPAWGTYMFDFERPEVRNFLSASAHYWIEEFHLDGLRVDAVAAMLHLDYGRRRSAWKPNPDGGRVHREAVEFLIDLNASLHRRYPGVITIAEDSSAWPGVTRATAAGGLGFSMKWDLGWLHDTLGYLRRDPVHRAWHHRELTGPLDRAWREHFVLPISHDEVVHGKGTLWSRQPGDATTRAAGVRAALAYQCAHPGKQLVFMGQEFGQPAEWDHDAGLDWPVLDDPRHRGIATMVAAMHTCYRAHPAFWSRDHTPTGHTWIQAEDTGDNIFAFLRHGADGALIACVFNFAGIPWHDHRLGLPTPGPWTEIFNTDALEYHGTGVGNLGRVVAEAEPSHGFAWSAEISIGANSAVWFTPTPTDRQR